MPLTLYNTLTRRKEPFEPLDPTRVGLYVCGPTVYDRAHIGNARAYVVFDLLYRLLRDTYGQGHVRYVRNITDIEDKINAAARKNGEPIAALTARTTAAFHEDLVALNTLPPDVEPRATESHPADDRDDRAADRERARLCRRGPCAVRRRLRSALRAVFPPQPRKR